MCLSLQATNVFLNTNATVLFHFVLMRTCLLAAQVKPAIFLEMSNLAPILSSFSSASTYILRVIFLSGMKLTD